VAKRSRDPVQLGKQVFDIAIGEADETVSESKRHPSKRRGVWKKSMMADSYLPKPGKRGPYRKRTAA
jgi:hypothetical protein